MKITTKIIKEALSDKSDANVSVEEIFIRKAFAEATCRNLFGLANPDIVNDKLEQLAHYEKAVNSGMN